eukprot:SAG11_NODE_98_length_16927_cov_35.166211_5_plen_92_part_00
MLVYLVWHNTVLEGRPERFYYAYYVEAEGVCAYLEVNTGKYLPVGMHGAKGKVPYTYFVLSKVLNLALVVGTGTTTSGTFYSRGVSGKFNI